MYKYLIVFASHNSIGNANIDTEYKIADINDVRQIEGTLNNKGFGVVYITNIIELSDGKKPFFYRLHRLELYLIPAEKIGEFDLLQQMFYDAEIYSEKQQELNIQIDELYGKYKVENNFITKTKFYLDIHPNENLKDEN